MSEINKIRLSGTDYDLRDVSATSVVEVTQQQYDDLPASAKTDNILYIITDSTVDYVTSAQTQSAITQAVSGKVDTATYAAYTAATNTALANKQTTLTAGTGIAITNNVISTTGGGNSVVELTQAAYDALVTGGTVDPDTFYIITDAQAGDLTNYYTKTETNTLLGDKADTATTYTKTETDNAITAATSTKQDQLVSGTNIKTINNESILGSGNIDIQGGGVNVVQTTGTSTTDVMSQDAVTSNFIYGINLNYRYNGRDTLALQTRTKNLFIPYMTINGKKVLSINDLSVVETSAITSSVTSASTDSEIPSAKAVNDKLGGLSLVRLTQAEYNALSPNYDSNTLYVING